MAYSGKASAFGLMLCYCLSCSYNPTATITATYTHSPSSFDRQLQQELPWRKDNGEVKTKLVEIGHISKSSFYSVGYHTCTYPLIPTSLLIYILPHGPNIIQRRRRIRPRCLMRLRGGSDKEPPPRSLYLPIGKRRETNNDNSIGAAVIRCDG